MSSDGEDLELARDKANQLAALLPKIMPPSNDAQYGDNVGALMRLAFDLATDVDCALRRIG